LEEAKTLDDEAKKKFDADPSEDNKKKRDEAGSAKLKILKEVADATQVAADKLLNDATEKASSKRAAALTIARVRRKQQDILRISQGEMAKNLLKLKNTKVSENTLNVAVIGLEIAINTLGKIQVIFRNTLLFWTGVRNKCFKLSEHNELLESYYGALTEKDDEKKKRLIKHIEEAISVSALNWLSLGNVNLIASNAMQNAKLSNDYSMNHIPNEREVPNIISTLTTTMLPVAEAQLKATNALLEECTKKEEALQKEVDLDNGVVSQKEESPPIEEEEL